jgi:23S rRNA (uracil1939-C5)-methyltransferase
MRAMQAALGERLHSLFWNGNPERTNVILGPHWQRLLGPETVREEIAGVGVHFPPGAFGQSHLALADRLARWASAAVPDGARVVEFHAGCGALGLGWLARVERAVLNELSPAALAGLAAGLAERGEAERARVRVLPGRAADHAEQIGGADVVVVDPPRRGLEPELLDRLVRDPPGRLLYVSCGLDAFERETRLLLGSGRLQLAELRVFDLFPWTEHVETTARFERR